MPWDPSTSVGMTYSSSPLSLNHSLVLRAGILYYRGPNLKMGTAEEFSCEDVDRLRLAGLIQGRDQPPAAGNPVQDEIVRARHQGVPVSA